MDLIISSTPYPLNSMDNLVSKYEVIYDIKTHLLFMVHFQEQLATVFASAGALFLSPIGMRPSWQLPSYSVGLGHKPVITHTWQSYTTAHTKSQKRATAKKILVWAQVTSHFTS